jgi:hypothetical protein
MKKIVKTTEEIRRDELVLIMREKKMALESLTRKIKRKQVAMTLLPENTLEYKNFAAEILEHKWKLVYSIREYETKREELREHCQTHHLAGNTFISGCELLEILAEEG